MEPNVIETLEKEFQDETDLTHEHPHGEQTGKNPQELSKEEETLQAHLDDLRRKNFSLRASIQAWHATLRSKLEELKQVQLKLDESYNEIWLEREKFCTKADEFNGTYGTLSDWWETQMKFVSDLEELDKKNKQEQQHREEIKRLEKEVEQLKKEKTQLEGRKQVTKAEVHATADEVDSVSLTYESAKTSRTDASAPPPQLPKDDTSPVTGEPKRLRYSESEEEIEIFEEQDETPNNVIYSMVDLERVREVNRLRRKTQKPSNLP